MEGLYYAGTPRAKQFGHGFACNPGAKEQERFILKKYLTTKNAGIAEKNQVRGL
jgi:hypothetical protein